jgi:Protein of unknown function (DUF3089)
MLQGMRRGSTLGVGWRTWLIAAVSAVALIVPGIAASAASAETTWLCKPGIANNPCESSLTATVQLGNGSSFTENAVDNKNAPIDCFYVYPTVSSQFTQNANLEIDPEETQIAIDQASRFSQTCKVYAPIYPQLTIPAINTPGGITPEGSAKAYIGAATAFGEYIEKYNKGRGFILIGHSQGAAILIHLIQEQFDTNTPQAAVLRKLMVGAILLGGNVTVPKGKTVGGTFKNVPACQVAGQTHCVIAYSSFLKEPPNPSFFGRVSSSLLGGAATEEEIKNNEVLCTNPSVLAGNAAGPLLRYESTTPFPGLLAPFAPGAKGTTPWVADPGQYSGQCDRAGGATWLQLTPTSSTDTREPIIEALGPLWGTHLEDVDVALGNLVANSGLQALNYQLFH